MNSKRCLFKVNPRVRKDRGVGHAGSLALLKYGQNNALRPTRGFLVYVPHLSLLGLLSSSSTASKENFHQSRPTREGGWEKQQDIKGG